VEALRSLSPSARIWLGQDATEENAKALSGDTRVVHFACHGFLDEKLPLESGLALSLPADRAEGRENGLLQAWEVFEKVRVDADLVTLSACQTGLGREMGGEGLLGLTWAFQYAGARSVLASLWEVGDASTAELMKRFYERFGAGVPKAEALRLAERGGRTVSRAVGHPATQEIPLGALAHLLPADLTSDLGVGDDERTGLFHAARASTPLMRLNVANGSDRAFWRAFAERRAELRRRARLAPA